MPQPGTIRLTAFFEGHVQGVGFRYTTVNIAKNYAVTGYVQNLPDGRVKLVAEGATDQARALIDAVEQRLGRFIRERTLDETTANGEFGQPGIDALTARY